MTMCELGCEKPLLRETGGPFVERHCGQVVKAFGCGPKVPGSNPTCCFGFAGKAFSLPLSSPLVERA